MDEKIRKKLKEQLLEEKRRLWDELREDIFRELGEKYHSQFENPMDIEEIAIVDLIEETGLSIAEIKKERLIQIEEALKRIEEGAYGTCEDCGKEIDEDRLSVMPFTTCCVRCQSKRELR